MSPKEVRITPGSSPRARKASISVWAVTHTGQPGPEMSCTGSGSRDFRPKRAAAMVWVPQTSMMVAGASGQSLDAADDLLHQRLVAEFVNILHRPESAAGSRVSWA